MTRVLDDYWVKRIRLLKIPCYYITVALLFTILCSCNDTLTKKQNVPQKKEVIQKDDKPFDIDKIKTFPTPELQKVLEKFETSGVYEKSPSQKLYNPDTKGLFVFYTLFERDEHTKNRARIEEIGSLITHTYFKADYGWSEEDTDQTFIQLKLVSNKLKLGEFIQVGSQLDSVIHELGTPIIKTDRFAIFLGRDHYLCKVEFKNQIASTIIYGKFNLDLENRDDLETTKQKILKLLD